MLVDTILYNPSFTVTEIKGGVAQLELPSGKQLTRKIYKDKYGDEFFRLNGAYYWLDFLYAV